MTHTATPDPNQYFIRSRHGPRNFIYLKRFRPAECAQHDRFHSSLYDNAASRTTRVFENRSVSRSSVDFAAHLGFDKPG
jgi:hypothetical protein